jgi:NADP-dependent 3-hydroxy acid dehydrogenase YdfG
MKNPLAKTVFVTGATSGIGKAVAKIFSKNGYNLIISGRREELLIELKEALEEKYAVKVETLIFDIRNPEEAKAAFDGMEDEWKYIDILVNNAGLAKGLDFIHEGNLEHWDTMIDTNIKGLLYMTRLVSPGMVEMKRGHIINICSTAGRDVYPKGNVYCATKAAVDSLTRGIRLDLYEHNIRVSQVSPGHTEETEFASVRFDGDDKKANIYGDFTPLRAKDVAEAVFFLATRPRHVNIQEILMMGTQQAGSNFIHRSGRQNEN